ncbi:MAG TPA: hypothetical protein VIP05_09945, partial [Burkholderiaceae bacterium]
DGAMTDLGTLQPADAASQSYATGINAGGTVVGYSVSHRKSLAFTWANGHMQSVNSQLDPSIQALWDVYTAKAVNDAGEILGWATTNGSIHMVLLTPEQ